MSTIPSHSQPSASAIAAAAFAIRTFLTRLYHSLRGGLSRRRPWLELVDRSSFSRPSSLSDATSRVRKNLSYFRVNYLTLIVAVVCLSFASHPASLLAILVLLIAWLFLYNLRPSDQPVVILGRKFSDRETLGLLILLSVIAIFLTNVGSLLISATLIGFGIVCIHGAFRDPEDLFLDDQEVKGFGLFAFISGNGSASSANVHGVPPIVSQV
ncbi:PREDICTED: PRA1 family protein B3-like [Ipomoea nil]|uniref:PRA1 family protein B3-like n=1 Tax=Ipomoea nil TaxID=35883 RepID=UPI000901C10A|nr:PREDICTED: PRA1 family protein B3-like [Ipomoea nil]